MSLSLYSILPEYIDNDTLIILACECLDDRYFLDLIYLIDEILKVLFFLTFGVMFDTFNDVGYDG
jgi:hypothetical protein